MAMGATTYEWVLAHEDLLEQPERSRVGHFADASLLDEIHLGVAPVTLGAGAPLLRRRLTSSELTLRSVDNDERFVFLVYDVSRR